MGYSNDKMQGHDYFTLGITIGFGAGIPIGMLLYYCCFADRNRASADQRLQADTADWGRRAPVTNYLEALELPSITPPPGYDRGSRISSDSPSPRASALLDHGQSSYSGDDSFDPTRPDASGEAPPADFPFIDESLETSIGPIPSTSAAITGERSDLTQHLFHPLEAPRAAGPASMPSGAQGVHAGRVSYRRGERGLDGMIDLGLDIV